MDLRDLSREELIGFVKNLGQKPFRGTQIFEGYHKQLKRSIQEMEQLPKVLRDQLVSYERKPLEILETLEDPVDGTKKFLYRLFDGEIVEGVLMDYDHGLSQCISTQVGCRMGCTFCASTKGGKIRDLKAGEILEQVYRVEEVYGKVSRFILMGSGEPMDNLDEVLAFLRILHDEKGQHVSYRHVTISTCGVVPGIERLQRENLPVNLALSLHSPFDGVRETMMPITKRYPVADVIASCLTYQEKTGRRVTYEYTLIPGVNDREEDIRELKRLFGSNIHHINLIGLNPIEEWNGPRSTRKDLERFAQQLKDAGLSATIRRELGQRIDASCGQLRRRYVQGKE